MEIIVDDTECGAGFNAGCAVGCSSLGMLGWNGVIVVIDAVDNLIVVGMVGVSSFDTIVVATALGNVEVLALVSDHASVVGM